MRVYCVGWPCVVVQTCVRELEASGDLMQKHKVYWRLQ